MTFVLRRVARCQDDDAFCAWQNFLRVDALFRIAFKPTHLTMIFLSEPALKLVRTGGYCGGGKTTVVKTKFRRALTDGLLHLGGLLASLNCRTICCATSRAERRSVLIYTSACR